MNVGRWSGIFALSLMLATSSSLFATNPIVIENQKPGVGPEVWDLPQRVSDPEIQGFSTDLSANKGETVYFKIKTPSTDYRIDIYRMGWYGGLGARLVATVLPSVPLPQAQPVCSSPPDCSNWQVSAQWTVPPTETSGVYVAKLVRNDASSGGSHIVFVVRDDSGASDILFQTSDTTWQAYNTYGGGSNSNLYNGATRVSYDRPLTTRDTNAINSFFPAEYLLVRWLERNGYDVSYFTGVDSARRGAEILEHRIFLSVGHDEYWSGDQRANVEAARDAGVHLAFFSGNEVFWKTFWDPSYRTMYCYKETAFGAPANPSGIFTGTWRDARFRTADDPARPENALTGTIFGVNGTVSRQIMVPEADGKMRLWRNTTAANLDACRVERLAPWTLGHEWDQDEDNGFRPPGLFRVATTPAHSLPKPYLGLTPLLYGPGTAAAGSFFNYDSGMSTHHMTMYRHVSGALVFGAGTVMWAWGLDQSHLGGVNNPTMQQAMVNLFADMQVQPATLQSGLVPAAASTDAIPPTSTITAPFPGASVRYGTAVLIQGVANDSGGRVAGVEVSVDGGLTWQRAEGRGNFRYLWMASISGPFNLRSRAVDDSGNQETAGPGVTVNVDCGGPCTVWPLSTVPLYPTQPNQFQLELGVRFRSDADGQITGIRFYKGSPDPVPPHSVHLWSSTGVLLATAVSPQAAPGWQTATFATPIPITANTTYVASFHTTSTFALTDHFFNEKGLYAPPLRVLKDGGVYHYGPNPSFPDSTYIGSNYWVDVLFTVGESHPRTLFGASESPAVPWFDDPNDGVELGVRFSSERDGLVTGIRFYKGVGNDGVHMVNLWAPTPVSTSPPSGGGGWLLASATAMNETASGWQTASFATPVPITAGVEYVASYYTKTGFAATQNYFLTNTVYDPPLQAIDSVYRYGPSAFPSQNYLNTNYWVEPVVIPTASFPASFWESDPTPPDVSAPTSNIEVGLRFKPEVNGYITGVRFFKRTVNGEAHLVTLWNESGQQLASATSASGLGCGWQTVSFAQPVPVLANTTYVASYYTASGYAQSVDYFAPRPSSPSSTPWKGIWNYPLLAPASIEGGQRNGVYSLGSHSFPSVGSSDDSNYWVDVVFTTTLR